MMLLCTLFCLISTRKTNPPIVVLPGLFDTILSAKKSNYMDWNCKSNYYDYYKNGNISNIKDYNAFECYCKIFGMVANNSGLYNSKFVESVKASDVLDDIKTFKSDKNEIYHIKYDWRIGLSWPNSTNFWDKLKNSIEYAFNENDQTKVCLVSVSYGGLLASYFLGKQMEESWVQKYINSSIFIAPAYSGSFQILDYFMSLDWNKNFNGEKYERDFIMNMPSFYDLLPNQVVHKDKPMLFYKNGSSFKINKIFDILNAQGKVSKEIYHKSEKIHRFLPYDPRVPVLIIYNSGINTSNGYIFKDDNTKKGFLYEEGDGVISAIDAIYGANWTHNDKSIVCIDFKNDGNAFNHSNLIKNPFVIKTILEFINDKDWTLYTGIKFFIAPLVNISGENEIIEIENRTFWTEKGNWNENSLMSKQTSYILYILAPIVLIGIIIVLTFALLKLKN